MPEVLRKKKMCTSGPGEINIFTEEILLKKIFLGSKRPLCCRAIGSARADAHEYLTI